MRSFDPEQTFRIASVNGREGPESGLRLKASVAQHRFAGGFWMSQFLPNRPISKLHSWSPRDRAGRLRSARGGYEDHFGCFGRNSACIIGGQAAPLTSRREEGDASRRRCALSRQRPHTARQSSDRASSASVPAAANAFGRRPKADAIKRPSVCFSTSCSSARPSPASNFSASPARATASPLHRRQVDHLRLPCLSVAHSPPHLSAARSRQHPCARLQGSGNDHHPLRHVRAE
jgi:hypothetical protein